MFTQSSKITIEDVLKGQPPENQYVERLQQIVSLRMSLDEFDLFF